MDNFASASSTSPHYPDDESNHNNTVDENHEELVEEQGTPAQTSFFHTLHQMLHNEASTGTVEWLSDNKSFIINQKKVFSNIVLPKYFGKAKYTSFTRRLKRWGFKRISGGENTGAYYHERFGRGMEFDVYDPEEIGGWSASGGGGGGGGSFNDESVSLGMMNGMMMSDSIHSPTLDLKQALPPKKRATHWSHEPASPSFFQDAFCVHSPPSSRASGCGSVRASHHDDVHAMPQLMRQINRLKRKEISDMEDVIETPLTNKRVVTATAFPSSSTSTMMMMCDEAAYSPIFSIMRSNNQGGGVNQALSRFSQRLSPTFTPRNINRSRWELEPSRFPTHNDYLRPPLLGNSFRAGHGSTELSRSVAMDECYSPRNFPRASLTPQLNRFDYQPEPSIAELDRMRGTFSCMPFSPRDERVAATTASPIESLAFDTHHRKQQQKYRHDRFVSGMGNQNNDSDNRSDYFSTTTRVNLGANNHHHRHSSATAASLAEFHQFKDDGNQIRVPIPDGPRQPKIFPYNRAA